MQRALERDIEKRLHECIDLKPYEAQGYDIEIGTMDVSVKIGETDVFIELDFLIELSREGEGIKITSFQRTIDLPLGQLYELAIDIVNSEIMDREFDTDEWMKNHGAEIDIEKQFHWNHHHNQN